MTKLDLLFQIKSSALHIENRLMSSDSEIVETAKREHEKLVDHFHHENASFMSLEQRDEAKNNFDYFTFLLEEALAYYKRKLMQGEEV